MNWGGPLACGGRISTPPWCPEKLVFWTKCCKRKKKLEEEVLTQVAAPPRPVYVASTFSTVGGSRQRVADGPTTTVQPFQLKCETKPKQSEEKKEGNPLWWPFCFVLTFYLWPARSPATLVLVLQTSQGTEYPKPSEIHTSDTTNGQTTPSWRMNQQRVVWTCWRNSERLKVRDQRRTSQRHPASR